ncbi:Dbl homology domain-containing protein [Hesseltinella vesiculosa]|uniref:Dbl homology domain-containing protein n=1 Tax=Hesseltinella vesiculosa TaxID=101127 RepID=A0A1X2GIX1_9FUNG|nr:Dbl homology domain-containing protein [Hesseltinella vesiculosa]
MLSHTDNSSYTFSSSTSTSNNTSDHTISSISYGEEPLMLSGQFMDDLSIIDDLYEMYGNDIETFVDKEDVAMTARFVASKEKVLHGLQRAELQYIEELNQFQTKYTSFISEWLHDSTKMTDKPPTGFLRGFDDLIQTHRLFFQAISDRMNMWGPTQLVSDVFLSFLPTLDVYDTFYKGYSDIIVSLHRLYAIPAFVKNLETQTGPDALNDLLRYIRLPLQRMQTYVDCLVHLIQYTDPCHIDYEGLKNALVAFKEIVADREEASIDADRHFRCLEVSRSIVNSPVEVTATRRLLLKAKFIKVDLDNLSSTDDVYTYILYNDQLIFCKSNGSKKQRKLLYKGSLDLATSELRTLSAALCAKLVETRRPLLSFSKSKRAEVTVKPSAYGFEFLTSNQTVTDSLPTNLENATAATKTSSNAYRKRHMIRTHTQEEQKLWVDTVAKVMQHMRWLHANQSFA